MARSVRVPAGYSGIPKWGHLMKRKLLEKGVEGG